MMPILANTRIKLGANKPKKDAVVDQPGTAAVLNEVGIWAATDVPENLTQSVVGDFEKLFRYAKSNMPAIAASVNDPVVIHMPTGGGDPDIEIDGVPTADEVRLEIGATIAGGEKSHFLKRTFDRLIERWLEESK
jgi:hypothetical protein